MISIPRLQRNQNLKLLHVSCSSLSLNYHGHTWISIPFRASGYSLGKWPLCFQAEADSLPFESFHNIHFYVVQVSSSLLSIYTLYTTFYLLVARIKTCELFKNSNHVLVSICKGTRLLSGTITTKIQKFGAEFSSTKQKKDCFFGVFLFPHSD